MSTALSLAEKCANAIRIIAINESSTGVWDDKAPSDDKSRWEQLKSTIQEINSEFSVLQAEEDYEYNQRLKEENMYASEEDIANFYFW